MEEEEEVLIPFIVHDRGVHFGLTTARNKCRHKRKKRENKKRGGGREDDGAGFRAALLLSQGEGDLEGERKPAADSRLLLHFTPGNTK